MLYLVTSDRVLMNGFVSRSDLYPSLRVLLSDQKFSFQAMMTSKELEREA